MRLMVLETKKAYLSSVDYIVKSDHHESPILID